MIFDSSESGPRIGTWAWQGCRDCFELNLELTLMKDGKIALAALSAVSGLCLSAQADSIVTDWNNATLEAIRLARPGPPIVARALAIVHTCAYDAWAAYDANALGTRYNEYLRRPQAERTEMNKTVAVSYAAYHALVDLFPAQKLMFEKFMNDLHLDPTDLSTDRTTAVGIGNLTSTAVLKLRHEDGSNQLGDFGLPAYSDPTGYRPINTLDGIVDPNHWQPLRFSDGNGGFVAPGFIAPHWGTVVPFALRNADQFRPQPPAQYPKDPRYTLQADEIIQLSASLNDRSKMIAEYWADGPRSELPPGHWNLFAQFISHRDKMSLDQDAKLFFALDNAMLDASIATWESKRFYDYCRPITAIHFLKKGKGIKAWAGPNKGTQVIAGENWLPYQPPTFITPPFPEYTSGHSAFSAAGAQILRAFTGRDAFGGSVTFKAGSGKTEPGTVPAKDLTLAWNTLSEAADEAGISRRYGGIHFLQGDLEGRSLGRRIGRQTWMRSLRYFNDPRFDKTWLKDDRDCSERDDLRIFGINK